MNITDVEDKIIRDMREQGKSLREFTDFYTEEFLKDVDLLNIERPELMPRATDHIPEMVEIMNSSRAAGTHTRATARSTFASLRFPNTGSFRG